DPNEASNSCQIKPCGPPNGPPPPNKPPDKKCEEPGCIIGVEGQTLSEEINVVGTPFFLRYDSDRTPGNRADYAIKIPLSGATLPAGVKRIVLDVLIAGRTFEQEFPALPNQTTTFTWDGRDAYNRVVQGRQPAVVRVGYVYDALYAEPAAF